MAAIASLIDQNTYIVPSFTLECGTELLQAPVAYKTWGKLNAARNNVMIICHAFTGSADVEDWWGPLMGRGKAFDPDRFFIFCANALGSPYGSASPLTLNPVTQKPYGRSFPHTTVRDDVRIHKLVLDHLGVTSVAVAIGGSMGGMTVLEWPLCTTPGYVKRIVPLATSARHSAWCISWGEAQRQSIYSDAEFRDGEYGDRQPESGLAAARMTALLTYRSRDSFENRFGRKPQPQPPTTNSLGAAALTPPESPKPLRADDVLALAADSEGHPNTTSQSTSLPSVSSPPRTPPQQQPVFSAQSYLRYQGSKFTARFDANCYIHITHKMDTHDLARDRIPPLPTSDSSTIAPSSPTPHPSAIPQILSHLPPRALIIGIETDGLFTTTEQRELASHIPEAELVIIPSPDGHDGFLLEFERINGCLVEFLRREFPEFYVGWEGEGKGEGGKDGEGEGEGGGFDVKKTSIFGEAEVDVAMW